MTQAYSADRSLVGKLRRRLARRFARRPARLTLERAMVSFTFDDVAETSATVGAKALEAQGLRGTFYVAAGLAGRSGPIGPYATAEALRRVAAAGHEIACHTYSHLDCGKADRARISADVEDNARAMAAWGAPPATNFAYPYGDVSVAAKRALGGRFSLLRALHKGLVETGADLNQAPSVGMEGPNGEADALHWLERAVARKAWLILYAHDVADDHSAWGCTPAALERVIAAAKAAGVDVVTVAEGARRLG